MGHKRGIGRLPLMPRWRGLTSYQPIVPMLYTA
ncbi:hypothetical protein BAE44_0018193 [Dichanthelium oligosanthes]|uniref:Uncharacterized protein n=1 Tax=Dichanthelium oligosanthes TaxID=888268 RepID=A0A1E5V6R3_9POAL|nr:hypothetical protein BAE44_0018193 [Dichanthelium oligosanthes]